jgi:peptidoglycan/xylan/chitin deacetylase (PgdA/CDA1 family)
MITVLRIRNIIVSILYLAYTQLKIIRRPNQVSKNCTFLLYHSVPAHDMKNFIQQMKMLKKVSVPVSVENDRERKTRKAQCVLTFDDAFRSVVINAAPELIRMEIPFTIFIPAGEVGKKPRWLIGSGHRDENEVVVSIPELRALPRHLVTFGSHTINHMKLTELSESAAYIEIQGSKRMLEEALGRKVEYLAFPYGVYNSKIVQRCKEIGYEAVFSTCPESPLAPMTRFLKGRVEISLSDWKIEALLKVLGGYGWKAWWKKRKRKPRMQTLYFN